MSIPVYQSSVVGQSWLSAFADSTALPGWASLGYQRVNQVLTSRNGAATQTLANNLADLTVYGGATAAYLNAEYSVNPFGGYPGLDGTGGATLNSGDVAELVSLGTAINTRHGGIDWAFYGQPSAQNGAGLTSANSQLIAAGVFAHNTAGIDSLQMASYSLGDPRSTPGNLSLLAQWLQGVPFEDGLITAWGAPTRKRWWFLQPTWVDQVNVLMPQNQWEGLLAYVAANANASRGDGVIILDGFYGTWTADRIPYYAAVAAYFPSVQPITGQAPPTSTGAYLWQTSAGIYVAAT